jgi:hypothetical protein
MSAAFDRAIERMKPLIDELLAAKPVPVGEKGKFPDEPGVYLISDGEKALYTGRCKSIRKRMGNHGGKSPESSTFAFRMACEAIGRTATYKKDEGRKALMSDESFRSVFHNNVEKIRGMNARFVVINDDVIQHLFEVYVHLALETPHNSFATH